MSNPLVAVVTDHLKQFVDSLDDEAVHATPCEIQLRGHMTRLDLDVTFGSGLWDGSRLLWVIALSNAFILVRQPIRAHKHYLYCVLRSRPPGLNGLRYTYILPPDDLFTCDVVDTNSQNELLLLDADVKNYARDALSNR